MEAPDVHRLIKTTRQDLARPVGLRGRAREIAMKIFLLSIVCHLADDPRVAELRDDFDRRFGGEHGDNLLADAVEYASRLATSPLIGEEMFLLFSVLDEIHALRALGYSIGEPVLKQLDADLRVRFKAQGDLAGGAALALAEEWNRSLWWYAERLPPGPLRHRKRRRLR